MHTCFHKYAYVHGDPIQGTDPTGMFWHQLYLNVKSAAANLYAYASIKSQILIWQLQMRFSLAYGGLVTGWGSFLSYHAMNFAARFPTWIPRIEFGLDVLDLGLTTLDGMSDLLQHVADDLDSMGPADRGRVIEDRAGANLTGNVKGIDDFRLVQGEDVGFATSIRSHDNSTMEGLRNSIRKDLYELYDKSRKPMYGTDANGVYREILPDEVAGTGLLVAIPESKASWAKQLATQVRALADSTETIVRIVPVKRWRGK